MKTKTKISLVRLVLTASVGIIFLLLARTSNGDTIYVDIRGECPADGSISKPYHNLRTAVEAADEDDNIIVQSQFHPINPQKSLAISKKLTITTSGGLVVIGQHQVAFVEIDKMQGTAFPPKVFADFSTGCTVSLFGLFDDGNIALDIKKDDESISAENTVTKQRLHQLMTANRNPAFSETSEKWTTYIFVAKRLGLEPNVLGVMFDFGVGDLDNLPREGLAVFYDAHTDGWSGQRLATELLLTSAHELGHIFNLHHTDWEGSSFTNGSSIMSYSLTTDVLWKISNRSFEHLTEAGDHPKEYVKPGIGAKAFGTITVNHCDNHQPTPGESYTCEEIQND